MTVAAALLAAALGLERGGHVHRLRYGRNDRRAAVGAGELREPVEKQPAVLRQLAIVSEEQPLEGAHVVHLARDRAPHAGSTAGTGWEAICC
ncbi:MAG: hypothetical protein ACO29A_02740, partial [Ilumatobacteraceae bacterium]